MHEPSVANRLHIVFGKRNAGKSSFINALTGQNIAIVSEQPGTTTDPVGKSMEIRGIGPVYIYDIAGIDDTGDLGEKRVARTRQLPAIFEQWRIKVDEGSQMRQISIAVLLDYNE